jgi:hypothetical protein
MGGMVKRSISVGIALVAALGLASCGGGDGDETSSGTSSSTTTTEQVTSTTGGPSSTSAPTTTAPRTTTTTTVVVPPTTQRDETQGWGTGPRSSSTMARDELYLVRVGRHDSYDRVVFDINGVVPGPDVAGYHVSYVPGEVAADASGEPVPTAGDAALQVVVRAPIFGTVSGHQPGRPTPRVGDDFFSAAQLRSWNALKQITFAGSFEGQTTIAIGVPGQRPFRVGSFESDGYTHVYVDVAHAR